MPDDPPVDPETERGGAGGNDTHRTAGHNTEAPSGRPAGTARPRRRAMAVVFVAAAVAFTAVGFGATLVSVISSARHRSSAGRAPGGRWSDLSGQMIGIDLTGSARGTSATSYAIPVNDALAVASRLKRS